MIELMSCSRVGSATAFSSRDSRSASSRASGARAGDGKVAAGRPADGVPQRDYMPLFCAVAAHPIMIASLPRSGWAS
jgi:hypothetical protein